MTGTEDPLDLPASLRALRHRADLSQRELAGRSGVPLTTVGSLESGQSRDPSFRTVERLVAATGARLAVLDVDGTPPVPLDTDHWRDRGGRHLPAHLDPFRVTWEGTGPVNRLGFVRNRRVRDLDRRERAGNHRFGITYDIRRLGPRDVATLAAIHADPALALGDEPSPSPQAAGTAPAAGYQPESPADAQHPAENPAESPAEKPPTSPAHRQPEGQPAGSAHPAPERALRYLRDSCLCHWIAEECGTGRVLAHLAARVHVRYPQPPIMVVLDFGVRLRHPDESAGTCLIAAMCDEATRLEVAEIVAAPGRRAVARHLRSLGFRRGTRSRLLTLPW